MTHVLLRFLTIVFPILLLQNETVNAQPRWRTLPNAPVVSGSRFDDVSFVNPSIGWIVGEEIYRTTDGGSSWQFQHELPTGFRSVGFADSLVGWVGALSSDTTKILYSTTDGGQTLEIVNIKGPTGHGICGICVASDSVVYGVGSVNRPARFMKTTNRGSSWIAVDMSQYASQLLDCYFPTVDTGFAVGGIDLFPDEKTVVLFTSDGGTTWETRYTGASTGQHGWKISFPTSDIGYVSVEGGGFGEPSTFLKTTDGGLTWQEQQFLNFPYTEQGVGFATENLGWLGGWSGPTYETTDGGDSWNLAGFGMWINRFLFLSDTLGYAVGQTVYKYSTDSVSVDVPTSPQEIPSRYTLSQNYPNPFNPITTIRYSLPLPSVVRISIYDVLGMEVTTLLVSKQSAGYHAVRWNGKDDSGKNLPSGVYFYRLEANGYTAMSKMTILR